jgi:hypothetical protein
MKKTGLKALLCSHQSHIQVREALAAQIFQLPLFEQVPDALLWIQLESIAGNPLQMEPPGCTSREKRLDLFRSMDREPVPNDQELAADLSQEQA